MRVDVAIVERTQIGEMDQKPAEQRRVHSWGNRKMGIGFLRRCGAARIDDDDFGAARALVLGHALEQHRVTPSGVRADQHEKIGVIEVLISARDGIRAKRADVAGNRGRHAQTRIPVHVRRADETFHQLVGDVIILGEELAGEIKGDRIGPVPRAGPLEAGCDAIERIRPVDARQPSVRLSQHGMKQTFTEPERLAECRALGADAAEIRGMSEVAGDRRAAISVGTRQEAAAYAAIGAGGAHGRGLG